MNPEDKLWLLSIFFTRLSIFERPCPSEDDLTSFLSLKISVFFKLISRFSSYSLFSSLFYILMFMIVFSKCSILAMSAFIWESCWFLSCFMESSWSCRSQNLFTSSMVSLSQFSSVYCFKNGKTSYLKYSLILSSWLLTLSSLWISACCLRDSPYQLRYFSFSSRFALSSPVSA